MEELIDEYAEHAKQLGALAPRRGRRPRRTYPVRLTPPHAHVHVQTQSYYLSASDVAGKPIEWEALVRMEELEEQMPPIRARHRQPRLETVLSQAFTSRL